MTRAKLKVLEMVAEGRITPEEGVRLIEALGEADRRSGGRSRFGMDLSDIRIARIDLGQIGEVAVELKKSVVEGAKKAHGRLKRSRAGRFFELKDYPIHVKRPEDMERCWLKLDINAGKLKIQGGANEASLLSGKAKRVPDEPQVFTEQRDGHSEVGIKHSLGRMGLKVNTGLSYRIRLDNAASDSRLVLEELRVEELKIDNNAGNVVTLLGELVPRVEVEVSNNAGNVRLKVPDTHAVRVTPSGSLSSHNLARYGLEPIDGVAQSADWDENPNTVDILLSQNVANFQLDWKRSNGVQVGDEEEAEEPAPDDDDDDDI